MKIGKILLGLTVAVFFLVAGCGNGGEEGEGKEGEKIETPQRSKKEEPDKKAQADVEVSLSEEDYIEYSARMQLKQQEHEDEFAEAMGEGDSEKVDQLQSQLKEEAKEVREQLGITEEELQEFEQQKPGFLGSPEGQEKIQKKIEELK
ncbi:MAG: hypothetical protein ACQEQC_00240 [Elusimicrobiota bacterium]